MVHRSPARWLAPLALVVFLLALVIVVSSSGGGDDERAAEPTTTQERTRERERTSTTRRREPRFYTVKLGDTPSEIADATGVSLAEIERLNPDLDPQLLAPGDKIKLRP